MTSTIKESPSLKVNLFRAGNLVINRYENNNRVVLTTGPTAGDSFTGVLVYTSYETDKIGELGHNWAKSAFKQFDGSVTLTA